MADRILIKANTPDEALIAVLGLMPSHSIGEAVDMLIERLDALLGDTDLEDDDPLELNGDEGDCSCYENEPGGWVGAARPGGVSDRRAASGAAIIVRWTGDEGHTHARSRGGRR